MKSRTALIALLGLGLLACASASRCRRDLKQYGSTPSYGSTTTYTGPNTIVVSGVIPPVQTCQTCTTGTVMNSDCPPELTENDPVQVITPCDIQYQTTTSKCTAQNVPDKFQNSWGGGKLHPDDITNINYHVGQYIDSTLYAQQGVPSSVSTNCFKKPAATYPAGYGSATPAGSNPAGYAKSAAVKHHKAAAAKPTGMAASPKPIVVTAGPKPVAPKPVASGYPAPTPSCAQPLYLDPVMVYGDVPVPACMSPGYVAQCSPTYCPPSYTPTCPNAYGDPMTGNYGTAGPYTGVVITKPGGNYASPAPSPNSCYVTAEWVQPASK